MATETNNEKKNEVVAQPKMTKEEMEKFVKDNLSIIPRNCRRKFDELKTIEQKVSKIRFYFDMQKMREEAIEKNKLENRVKDLFIKRRATTEDVVRVIDFCKEYIQTTKQAEIDKLQTEIDRLTHLKQTLETN